MPEESIKSIKCKLRVRAVELLVYLGWEAGEREQQQIVTLDIDIHFQKCPKACDTDELDDTVCYAELVTHLRQQVNQRSYRLVEHLTQELYALIKREVKDALVTARLTKYPQVEGLTGGVTFSYGDF